MLDSTGGGASSRGNDFSFYGRISWPVMVWMKALRAVLPGHKPSLLHMCPADWVSEVFNVGSVTPLLSFVVFDCVVFVLTFMPLLPVPDGHRFL